jgi:hypothetical protein
MKLSERFRRFWLPSHRPADHPLSEEERDWTSEHPDNSYAELATEAERRVGDAFDPDEKRGM